MRVSGGCKIYIPPSPRGRRVLSTLRITGWVSISLGLSVLKCVSWGYGRSPSIVFEKTVFESRTDYRLFEMSITHIFHRGLQECDVTKSQISHGTPTTHHSRYNFLYSRPKSIVSCASNISQPQRADKHNDTNVQLNQCHGIMANSPVF